MDVEENLGLELYALTVGGGQLALSPLPGAGGGHEHDVATLRAWGADLVIGVTEVGEMQALGAAALPDALSGAGMTWVHWPIRDFDVPDRAREREWPALLEQVKKVLEAGGKVLVHCRGGCGRSGMVVLRLLLGMGEPLGEALSRLRDLRPCAIETDAQMVWASEGRVERA
ncbi:dual specificity protein phosphatase family protein [Shimia sp. R11_0]|uniref:phosphatase domain-containing putative toxin n=1 Tax=Shimia sp. R11_0 TaxID=2821096 RepID=UPI0032AF1E61